MAAPSAEIEVNGAEIEFYVFCKIFLDIKIHFQEILNFRRVLCSTSPQRAMVYFMASKNASLVNHMQIRIVRLGVFSRIVSIEQ